MASYKAVESSLLWEVKSASHGGVVENGLEVCVLVVRAS